MAAPETDFARIYDFIYRIDSRTGYLEKDIDFIDKKISKINALRQERYSELKNDFDKLKNDMSSTKSKLQECTLELIRLGHLMRNAVKQGQVDSIKEAVDNIPFTDYITTIDLKRGLL